MRLSVSAKIFLGFTVVILAFGSACAYTVYRMTTLRQSVAVMGEVLPVVSQLKDFSWRLRSYEKYLEFREPTDAQWLTRLLPSLEPFSNIEKFEQRLEQLMLSALLSEPDRAKVETVLEKLRAFRAGTDLADALRLVAPEFLAEHGAATTSEQLYEALMQRTVQLAIEGRLTGSSRESRAMVRAFRRINLQVIEGAREVAEPIHDMNERAEADEKAATLAVAGIAAGALVLSLVMLLYIRFTLAPISRLQTGARRIAAGDYDQRVEVASMDEIGQLAHEFNTMASALEARDRQLARQREELLRQDRLATIGKIAAQITHEVRNPLSSIGLNAELLEEELDGDPESRDLLAAIQGEVQRLKDITEEYLTYARLPKPDLALVNITELLSSLLSFLRHELDASGVTLVTRGLDAPLPLLPADAHQLRQAFLNIAKNAIEAMSGQETPATLEVALEAAPADGVAFVEVTIADTGPGLEASVQDRVFEPFVTGKAGGTGLGLALTHQIIVDHGGEITGEGRGDGTSGALFRVRLPAQSATPPPPVVAADG